MSSPRPRRFDRSSRSHREIETRPLCASEPLGEHARPFGAHLRMSWWKPLVVVVVLLIAMILCQLGLSQVAAVIEGGQGALTTLTPLRLLAANLGVGIAGLLAVPFIAWFAKVPWRSVLSFPRRFDGRRLLRYLGVTLVVIAGANAALAVLAPESTTWTTFAVTGTTVTLLAVVVLTTPLQALGEELMFRGAIMPALASWVRPVLPALVVGVLASSPVFAVAHAPTDPWQVAYYTFLGLCFATMAVVSRGLEASIALHVVNNGLTLVLNVVFAGGGALVLDRAAVPGGPHLLIPVPFMLAAVGVVWWYERRRRTSTAAAPAG